MTINRSFLGFLAVFIASHAIAQHVPVLKSSPTVPPKLLSSRCVALFDYRLTQNELNDFQRGFQRIGIDVIAYFPDDVVYAGKDGQLAYLSYFNERQISFVVFLQKAGDSYRFTLAPYNSKPSLVDTDLPAWQVTNVRLNELLTTVLQDSWSSQKKANYLVNEFAETDISVDAVKGRRQEFYAIDLKVDNLAVPRFGVVAMDTVMENFFAKNYPLKYKIVDFGSDEQELRRKGFLYVLCYVHTRGEAAKQVLGYDLSKGEKSYASIAFPEGQVQLKVLPKDEIVYKFYFRHIENGNIFLGTKWDADVNWLDALRNHVLGFKQEAKIN